MNTTHMLKWFSITTLILLLASGCSSPTPSPTPTAPPIATGAADLPTTATDTPPPSIPIETATTLAEPPTATTEPTLPPFDRTAEQYAIYSAVLASGAPNYDLGNQVIILDQTQPYELDRFPVDLSALTSATVEDYKAANTTPQPLATSFDLTLPYVLISETERQQYINDWPAFFAAYPDAEGILTFSAAGFNTQADQALVYMAYLCGPLCGAGDLYVMSKETDTWQVQQVIGLWMS